MPTDATITVKILTENAQGVFPIGSATPMMLTTRSRYLRPYPPGGLRFHGVAYGTWHTFTLGDQVFDWYARNRLTQTDGAELVRQDAADVAAEVGTTYKVQVWTAGVLRRTIAAIAVETFTYAVADRISDGGAGAVTLKFFSNANGLDSFYSADATFEMTGFGMDFGRVFGGLTL
jgi:hypothetical protein